MFGKQSSTRALPLARKGELYFSEAIESGSTEHKRVSPPEVAPNINTITAKHLAKPELGLRLTHSSGKDDLKNNLLIIKAYLNQKGLSQLKGFKPQPIYSWSLIEI